MDSKTMEAIKKMEEEARKQAMSAQAGSEKKEKVVTFDIWFASNMEKIPQRHRKEVIKASFKAQGLKDNETEKTFDAALKRYGLAL